MLTSVQDNILIFSQTQTWINLRARWKIYALRNESDDKELTLQVNTHSSPTFVLEKDMSQKIDQKQKSCCLNMFACNCINKKLERRLS